MNFWDLKCLFSGYDLWRPAFCHILRKSMLVFMRNICSRSFYQAAVIKFSQIFFKSWLFYWPWHLTKLVHETRKSRFLSPELNLFMRLILGSISNNCERANVNVFGAIIINILLEFEFFFFFVFFWFFIFLPKVWRVLIKVKSFCSRLHC